MGYFADDGNEPARPLLRRFGWIGLRVTLVVGAAAGALVASGSKGLGLLIGFAALRAVYAEAERYYRGPEPATPAGFSSAGSFFVLIGLGIAAWLLTRWARWRLGEEVAPAVAFIAALYLWLAGDLVRSRRRL